MQRIFSRLFLVRYNTLSDTVLAECNIKLSSTQSYTFLCNYLFQIIKMLSEPLFLSQMYDPDFYIVFLLCYFNVV